MNYYRNTTTSCTACSSTTTYTSANNTASSCSACSSGYDRACSGANDPVAAAATAGCKQCCNPSMTCPAGWTGTYNECVAGDINAKCSKTCDCSLPANALTVSCAATVYYNNACSKTITQCQPGYYLYNNTCNTCPQYATCDGTTTVVCDAPLAQSGSGASISCVCPSGASTTGSGGPLGGSGGCKCTTVGENWDPVAKVCSATACSTTNPAQYKPGNDCLNCPVSGEAGATISAPVGATAITQCVKTCPSEPVGWPNSTLDGNNLPTAGTGNQQFCASVSPVPPTISSTVGGTYATCQFTVTSQPGYDITNNNSSNPSCPLHQFNIQYYLLGTLLSKPAGWTAAQWPTTFNVQDGTVALPLGTGIDNTCVGATFAGWYKSAAFTGSSYANVPMPSAANCADCQDPVFYAKMTCSAGYHATATQTAVPCHICDPDVATIEFNGNGNDSGTAPANLTCTFAGACTLPGNTGGLGKSPYYVFSQWCDSAAGTGTCYLPGADLSSLAAGKNGGTITLYAKWTNNGIECPAGQYFQGAPNTACSPCESGDYCPGPTTCDKTSSDECGNISCATVGDGSWTLSAAGTSSVSSAACYKNCSPTNYCASPAGYTGGTWHYGDAACGYTISSCAAGYYLNNNTCTICPSGSAAAGQTLVGQTNGCNAGGDANCFVTCVQPPLPVYATGITPATYDVNYNAGYAACSFAVECDNTHNPVNNNTPNPICAQTDHIDYFPNGGAITWVNPEYFNISAGVISVKTARVPTRAHSNFVGWYATADFSGGEITAITTGGNHTLYARWQCQGGYYLNAAGDACIEVGVGYYSPNGDNNRYACPTGFTTGVSTISTQITSCYADQYVPEIDSDCDAGYRRATVLGTTPAPADCNAGTHTCVYLTQPALDLSFGDSSTFPELTPITAAGGFWYNTAKNSSNLIISLQTNNICGPVGDGYYSPDHDAATHQCPAGSAGSDMPRDDITTCFKNCPSTPSGWNQPNCAGVTPYNDGVAGNAKISANANGTYDACLYLADSKPGYDVIANGTANPSCAPHQFTIEYHLLSVDALNRPATMAVVQQWPTTFQISQGANVLLPVQTGMDNLCVGAKFDAWYELPMPITGGLPDINIIQNWANYVTPLTTVPLPVEDNCADCQDYVFFAKMTCQAGYHNVTPPTASPAISCDVCAPDAAKITFDGNTATGTPPADINPCTYKSGTCAMPDQGGLTKTGGFFVLSEWCTNANGTGDCFAAGEDASNVLPKGKDGQTIIMHAIWIDTGIECPAGQYFTGAPATSCANCGPNDYCPGQICDKTKPGDCGNKHCSEYGDGTFTLSAGGTAAVDATACYKNCQPSDTCAPVNGTQYTDEASCQYPEITSCAAGFFVDASVPNNQCTICPSGSAAAGQTIIGQTDGCNTGGNTNCFVTCVQPPLPLYAISISPATYNVNYDAGYETCDFTVVCDDTHKALNNGTPTPFCGTGNKIAYDLKGGTWVDPAQLNPEYFNPTQPVALPANAADTITARQPTRANSTFNGWYESGALILSTDEDRDYNLVAGWTCNAGYYLNLTGDGCIEVGTGFWSPNGDNNRYKCPDGYSTGVSTTSSTIQSCYVDQPAQTIDPDCDGGYRRVTVMSATPKPAVCDATNTCTYASQPTSVSVPPLVLTYSELTTITAGAGYWADKTVPNWIEGTNLCIDVTSGWYSPALTATRTQCPAGSSGSDGGAANPSGPRAGIGNCYYTCPALTTLPAQATGAAADPAKVYHDGAQFPECTYTVECADTPYAYCPANNNVPSASPSCEFCGICPDGYYCDPDPLPCPATPAPGWTDGPGVNDINLCQRNCPVKTVANGKMIPVARYATYPNACEYTLHCGAGYKPNAAGTACVQCAAGEICPCDPLVDANCGGGCDAGVYCCADTDTGECDAACLAGGKTCCDPLTENCGGVGQCDSALWCCPDEFGQCGASCLATGKPCWPDPLMCIDLGNGAYYNPPTPWKDSKVGASSVSDCYAICPLNVSLPGGGGTMNPITPQVYYDEVCKYPTDCTDPSKVNTCACNHNAPGCVPDKCTTQNIFCDAVHVLSGCECLCAPGYINDGAQGCALCPPGSVVNMTSVLNSVFYVLFNINATPVPGKAPVTGTLLLLPGGQTNSGMYAQNNVWPAQTACWYCGAGLYASGGVCAKCPIGTYKRSGWESNTTCATCPAHSICVTEGMDKPTCQAGYNLTEQTDGTYTCDAISATCAVGENGYGTTNKDGVCVLSGCLGDNHISADGQSCEPNSKPCTTAAGTGYMLWNPTPTPGSFGPCIETACQAGYQNIGAGCVPCAIDHAIAFKSTGTCAVSECDGGFHVNPTANACDPNSISCVLPHATIAVRNWANNQFGECKAMECEAGFHISSNACVINTQACDIENGTGTQEWIGNSAGAGVATGGGLLPDATAPGGWGECNVVSCNPGFTNDPTETNERDKPCGVCRNKFSTLGEIAVSTYSSGCEIAACMYQGQSYDLQNNECVPLCDARGLSDETGTVVWNPNTHKCDITCNAGYSSW